MAATRKIQIEQSAPTASVRKGSYATERNMDPNDVVIKRRLGEGSKPLFQRNDIVVNPDSAVNLAKDHTEKQLVSESNTSEDLANHCRRQRRNSTDFSSPERYEKYKNRNNDCATSNSTIAARHTKGHKTGFDSYDSAEKRTNGGDSSPKCSHRRRTPEKLPYFIDEVRERDRLRRKYGTKLEKPSSASPSSSRSRRRRTRSLSRSRSNSKSLRTQRRSISRDRYLGESNRRERENIRSDKKRDKTYSRYRHRSEDGSKSSRRYRSSRSPSKSRSRSRARVLRSRLQSSHNDRRKYRHSEQDGPSNNELAQRILQQPQIITIPVPVPADFMNYAYSTWPTPTQWTPAMAHPPRYGTPAAYHMPAILPATLMPPLRPRFPAYGLPPPPFRYAGRGFRSPMQYGHPRPWRPNFRSKNP